MGEDDGLSEPTRSLKASERSRLIDLEAIVSEPAASYRELGGALAEIAARRLYRLHGDATFADYAASRWRISRARAYRLVEAAKVLELLAPLADVGRPANEAQARELVPLIGDPARMRQLWRAVVDATGGRVTAAAIRAAIRASGAAGEQTPGRPPDAAGRQRLSCPRCGYAWDPPSPDASFSTPRSTASARGQGRVR